MGRPGEEPFDVVAQFRERGIGDDAEDADADPGGIRAAVARSVMTKELEAQSLSHPFSAVLRKLSESESMLTAARTEWAKCRKSGQ